jgi:hypothetical protein
MLLIYQCEFCGEKYPKKSQRCKKCNYAVVQEVEITESEYCEKFGGHDEGNVRIAGTEQEGTTYREWENGDDHGFGRWWTYVHISHQHRAKCARCGNERTYRCKGCARRVVPET